MKRREYLKEYRQKNKSKLNEYHKKYHHSKKKKNEEKVKDDHKVDDEEIKSIDLGKNNENDNNNNDSDNDVNSRTSDSNNESDNEKEKEEYINVSFIIEEMKSLKDELEATRSLLENTNLLVEILNDELVKKHRHIKHLKNQFITEGNNNEDYEENENNENNENDEENNEDVNKINYGEDNNNDYDPELTEKDIMDIDFNANKKDFFANHEYKGLKLKNKEDEIKVLKMLKKYADDIRNKMDEKDKILSDHKKKIDAL